MRKWIAVAALFITGISLGNAPSARACAECYLEPCFGTGAYGWSRNTFIMQHGYLDVFLHNPKCQGFNTYLYWNCFETGGCGSASSSGLLFNLDGDRVTAFSVKSKQDAEALLASLNYLGLTATVKTRKPLAVLSAEELAHPSIQTLAQLGLSQSDSCAVAGK